MTHAQAQSLLLDLAYGELSPDEAREVERHAAECAACAAELEGLLATRRLAARLADEPVPARGRAELLAAARLAASPAPARRRLRSRVYAIAASAAVIALVAGVTLRLTGQRSALRGREDFPELRDLAPMEDVAPSPAPVPAAPAPARKRQAAPPVTEARPSRAPAPAPLPSSPRQDIAAERRGSAPSPSAAEPLAPSPSVAEPLAPSPGRSTEAPAPAARAPAGAPPQPLAAAPERSETSRAPKAARRAELPERAPASEGPRSIVDDIERRAAAGQLRQEERRLTCDGEAVERQALLDGVRVLRLTVRTDDGTVYEGWYDGGGRLRAERRSAGGRPAMLSFPGDEASAEAELSTGVLPSRAPAPAALPRCAW